MKTSTKVAGFTAEGVFVKLSVPEGMDAALQGLTREVLRHQPSDIYWFAAQYFESLVRSRAGERVEAASHHEVRSSTRSSRTEKHRKARPSEDRGGSKGHVAATGSVVALAAASAPSWETIHSEEESKHVHDTTESQQSTTILTRIESQSGITDRSSDNLKAAPVISGKEAAAGLVKEETTTHEVRHTDAVVTETTQHEVTNVEESKSELNTSVTTHSVYSMEHEIQNATEVTTESDTANVPSLIAESQQMQEELGDETTVEKNLEVDLEIINETHKASEEKTGKAIDLSETKKSVRGNLADGLQVFHDESDNVGDRSKSKDSLEKNEPDDLDELHKWANTDIIVTENASETGIENKMAGGSPPQTTEEGNGRGFGRTKRASNEPLFDHFQSSVSHVSAISGDGINELASEETHERTEESILKSASHDIRCENLGEGSQSVTEEKSEEMKEATLQTSKSTIQKSKSNIQIQDNGDTIEEEVIYTRMEESSRQETTVSKTWTIETTIETTADGETKVVERMILHSPPPGEEHSPESIPDMEATNKEIELSTLEAAERNVEIIDEIDTIKNDFETSGEEETTDEKTPEEDLTQKTEPSSLDIPSEHIITDGARRLQIEGLLKAAQDSASDDGPDNFPVEDIREFGLIDPEESMKSIDKISIALSQAEESLNMLHATSEREAFEVDENGEKVKLTEVPDNAGNLSEVHRRKNSADGTGDFGLISPEDTRRSLEKISLAIAMAEESLDKLPPDNSKSVLMPDGIDKSDKQETQGPLCQDVSGVVSHDIESTQQHEFGLIDLEHAQKSSKHISAALNKAEETLFLLNEGGFARNDQPLDVSKNGAMGSAIGKEISQDLYENSEHARQDTKKVEVDENGEEIVTQISSRMAEGGSVDVGREEAGRTTLSTVHGDIQDAILQPQLMMNLEGNSSPFEDAKLDKNSESSRNGSKEDSFSEAGGFLSNVREYGTDEDQATPRDEVESLRIDTPLDEEQSTGTKSSTGSEGNGEPINPLTVVISRTADVIELKDGEVNIVTQMEKEGLVSTDAISAATDDSDIQNSPTESTIAVSDLTTVDAHTPAKEGSIVDHFHPSVKVAGMAVVASATFSAVHNVEESISDKATDILTARLMSGNDVSHFIEKESEHTRLLLTESLETKTDSRLHRQPEEVQATDEKETENDVVYEIGDIVADTEGLRKIEVSELNQTDLNLMEQECHLDSTEDLESENKTSETDEQSHNVLEMLEVSAPFQFLSTGSNVDENGDFVVVPARRTEQTPVDENAKPIHSIRERRSTNEINDNEQRVRQGSVRLTSTGSLIGEDAGGHWYGSNMVAAEAALIRPVLAVPLTQPAQEPCEEPPCIAIDIRNEKKENINIFKTVSSTSSAAGQAILVESHRVVAPTPIHEGMDVMLEMSKITSRIGQTVLVLGSEARESDVDEKERPARTDSQDSYVISDDAIYIPLNPPGPKLPDLERIDSIASFSEMEKESFDLEHDKLQFRESKDLNESTDNPLILAVHASSEAVSPVKSLASAQEAIEGDAFQTFPEGNNEADDVLIVECPVDSKAGVTDWDSVVVTSHDQVRERHDIEHEVKPKDFQLLDIIPAEHATSFSLDDSLHEVPSLQDEAVIEPSDVKVDSGNTEGKGDKPSEQEEKPTSILEEQVREDENSQRSTSFEIPPELSLQRDKLKKSTDEVVNNIADGVAVTVTYASDIVKDIQEPSETEKNSVAAAEKTALDTDSEEDAKPKQKGKAAEGAAKELLASDMSSKDREPATSFGSSVVLHATENVDKVLKSATEAGDDVAEWVKEVNVDVTDSAQQVTKTASEGMDVLVNSAVKTAKDASMVADVAVKEAVLNTKGSIQSFEDKAQSLVTEVVEDAHHKVLSLREETSSLIKEGKQNLEEEAATAIDTVHSFKSDAESALGDAAEGVHSLKSDAESALGGAAEAVYSLKSDAESALGGAAEAVHSLKSEAESALGGAAEAVHSLKSDAESALSGAAEAVHSLKSDAESALSGAAEAVHSLKSDAESALGGAAEAVHSHKSDAESALGDAAEAVHSLKSDAESALSGAAEAVHSLKSDAESTRSDAEGAVHSLKSDAESALGGAAEAVHSLKSDAESALGDAAEAVHSLKSDAESALSGAAEAVHSLKSDAESTRSDAEGAVHSLKSDAESALGGAAEAVHSLKSDAESALGGAAEAVHSLKSDAESALGGAAEAVHSLKSDAESALSGAAEAVHSLKSDAESTRSDAEGAVHSLKSDAESALGGAAEAVHSLKSDAESALSGAAKAIDSEINKGTDRLLPDDLRKDANEMIASLQKAAEETESFEALDDLVLLSADESLKQDLNQVEEIKIKEGDVLSKAKVRSTILRSDESTVMDSESRTASPELEQKASESGQSKEGNKTTDSAQRSIPSIKFEEPSQQSIDASRDIEDEQASGASKASPDEGDTAADNLTSNPQATGPTESSEERKSGDPEEIHISPEELEETEVVKPHALEEIEKEVEIVVQKAFESAEKEEREMHLHLASAAQESSSIFISKMEAAKSETEEALEIANASVNEALNRAEKTITSEAEKAHSVLVSVAEGSSLTKGRGDHVQEDENQKVCTDSETGEAAICTTVRTTVKVHELAEGIHERLRQEVSTLRLDSKETSGGTVGHDPQVRKTRIKSDITARKTQVKAESWESNLRKSEPSPRTPRSSSTTPSEGSGKKSQSFIPKPMKRATTSQTQGDSKPAEEPRRKPPLRKTRSLSEGASEDAKRRVKKMPSQGSTKRTAISAESVVEVAGETVAQEAINRAKSSAVDSGEETGSESSGALSARMEVVRETDTASEGVKSELAQAAATIQDTFRGISERTQGGPVDEDGNEIPQPALGRSFQIEPVLEETAEEMKDERQGSMQTSVSLDQENTSTSDSSMSSAATKIQAGFRGYLARRHRRHSTTSTATLGDMSMSRSSSLLEDSEVQRHRMSPLLDQLPEAEHGPAKYVADMHTEGKRVGDCTRSLDSGLSSGTVSHPPVRNAMSVAPSRDMDGDLDEQVWRTLERELAADEADSEETVEVSRRRRLSSRQYAMQLPTTSSSTASQDGLPARHSGEFHDMLVLPLHSGPGPGPQALPSAGCSRAGFSLNGLDSSEGAAREAAGAGGLAGAARAVREAEDMKPPASTSTSATANGAATGSAISHSQDQDQDQDQCRHRGMEGGGRLRCGTGPGWLPAQVDGDLVQRSAARIQAGVRGFLVRRRQHNASQAAAKIQAGFRGYRARRDMKLRRAQHAPHAPHAQQ